MIRRLLAALLLLPTLAFGDAYSTQIISEIGFGLYWRMNETSGTTLANSSASSGSAYDMTTHNTPTLNQAGVVAARAPSILWTSASSQYADVTKNDTGSGPGDIGQGDRTIECWTKVTTDVGYVISAAEASTGTQASRGWGVAAIANSGIVFQYFDAAGTGVYQQLIGSTNMTAGSWYAVAVAWTLATHKSEVFLNGVSDGSTTTVTGSPSGSITYWNLSRLAGQNVSYYGGNSQDCAVYLGTVSAATLLAHYNLGVATGITTQGRRIFQSQRDRALTPQRFAALLPAWMTDTILTRRLPARSQYAKR